uniref:HDC14905 n=1 Tax=Drosophila melanogaster TaxID=7227 RepID=Q6IJH5_DROME|nr:TPA_inf: HDC14905 [Drosophila melanogaster]
MQSGRRHVSFRFVTMLMLLLIPKITTEREEADAAPDAVGQAKTAWSWPWPRMDAVLGVLFGPKSGGKKEECRQPAVKVANWQHRIPLDRQTQCNANGQQPADGGRRRTESSGCARPENKHRKRKPHGFWPGHCGSL